MSLVFIKDLALPTVGQIAASMGSVNQSTSRVDIDSASYSSVRGLLAPKNYSSEDEILLFQFNPTEIRDSKQSVWNERTYPGFSANDYFWANGGPRVMSFTLQFDATAGTNNVVFGKNTAWGNEGYTTLGDIYPKGVMGFVEKLTSFQYPIQVDATKPRYSSGLAIPNIRFMPPPVAIFVLGDFYLEAVVTSVDTTYTLFNKKLQPIRCECSVSLSILETDIVPINDNLLIKAGIIGTLSNAEATKTNIG